MVKSRQVSLAGARAGRMVTAQEQKQRLMDLALAPFRSHVPSRTRFEIRRLRSNEHGGSYIAFGDNPRLAVLIWRRPFCQYVSLSIIDRSNEHRAFCRYLGRLIKDDESTPTCLLSLASHPVELLISASGEKGELVELEIGLLSFVGGDPEADINRLIQAYDRLSKRVRSAENAIVQFEQGYRSMARQMQGSWLQLTKHFNRTVRA